MSLSTVQPLHPFDQMRASPWAFLVYSFLINISVYNLPSTHLKTFTKHAHGRKQRGGDGG